MGNTKKYVILSLLTLIACTSLPFCLAADSPQYILGTYAVDASGNQVPAVITPTDGLATIYIATTIKLDDAATFVSAGFSCNAEGTPRVNLNTVSNPINTIINPNGSTTYIYQLGLGAYNVAVPSASFVYYVDVYEDGTTVRHEATVPLVYSVNEISTVTATPTPTATATETPSETASPSPTVPELPVATVSITIIAAATFAAVALKKKQTFRLPT
jgi:hypothetical protein